MSAYPPQPPSNVTGSGPHGPGASGGATGSGTASGPTGGASSPPPGLPPEFLAFAHFPGVWFREVEVVPLPSQDVRWERLTMEVVTPTGQQVVMQRTWTSPPLACGTPLGHWSEICECVVSNQVVHVAKTSLCKKCGDPAWKRYTAQRYDIFGRSISVCFNCLVIIDTPTLWERRWDRLTRRLGKGVWW